MCYNMIMKWLFLSPHLDDVVFSCGGFIWDLTSSGQDVEVWTICTADPRPSSLSDFASELHNDWGLADNAYQNRRKEDQTALQILGAQSRYLSFLDCIYRQSQNGNHFYDSEEALFGGLDATEFGLIDELIDQLESMIPDDATIIAPLGIGNHVDHELVRKAANRLSRSAYYYADFPYAREPEGAEILSFLSASDDWSEEIYPVSKQGISSWFQASLAYKSQLTIFWNDQQSLENEIRQFAYFLEGMKLWKTIPDQ